MLCPILAEADAARAPVPVAALADDEVSAAADGNSNPADSTLDPATLARARLILERILHELPPWYISYQRYWRSQKLHHIPTSCARLHLLSYQPCRTQYSLILPETPWTYQA